MRKLHSLPLFFLLATLLVFSSCKEEDDDLNPNLIIQDFYFQAVLDGDTVTYQDGLKDYGNIVGDFYGSQANGEWVYAPFTCIASNDAVTNPLPALLAESGAVSIIIPSPDQKSTVQEYQSLVTTGTFPIGYLPRSAADSAITGAFISIFDADAVEWNTNNGPTAPAGSVVVNEYSTFVDNDRIPATQKIFSASFECTVYNSAGQSKQVTGGLIRGRMIRWQ